MFFQTFRNWKLILYKSTYLCSVAIWLNRCRLAALLHWWRWGRRRWEALSTHSGHLQQRHCRVEVYGDLRRHGIGRCRLQADRQGSSWALHGVVMKNIKLRRNRVHQRDWSVSRDCLERSIALWRIWRIRITNKERVSGQHTK